MVVLGESMSIQRELYASELLDMNTDDIVDVVIEELGVEKKYLMEEEMKVIRRAVEGLKKRVLELTFDYKCEITPVDAYDVVQEIASCAASKDGCDVWKYAHVVALLTWNYWYHLPSENPELYVCGGGKCVGIIPAPPEGFVVDP